MSGLRERPADHVQALMRGLRILEYVYGAGAPVAVREVAEVLDLNVSTAHHLVNALVWEGYLVRTNDIEGDREQFATVGGPSHLAFVHPRLSGRLSAGTSGPSPE